MTSLTRFPDLYRYLRSEANPTRLIAGFVTTNLICLSSLAAMSQVKDPWGSLFRTVMGLQLILLLTYGVLRTTTSILQERSNRTWDFQRLTPLTSFEITFGKLLGAPIFAYFLFLVMMPWAVLATSYSTRTPWLALWQAYRLPLSLVFLCLNLGLLFSAHSLGNRQGRSAISFVTVAALWTGLPILISVIFGGIHGSNHWLAKETLSFYGLSVSVQRFATLSSLIFGGWAFAGARWRIGEDLLEGRRFWRFPAFLLFLAWYLFGIEGGAGLFKQPQPRPIITLGYVTFFVYVAAFLWGERTDYWRRWLRLTSSRMNNTPVWVAGYATLLAVAGLLLLIGPRSRVLVLLPVFCGRDLLFLQWCRFTRSQRAEMMAFIYLVLAYVLPPMLLAPFKLSALVCLYSPIPVGGAGGISLLQNLLPGLLEAGVMAGITFRRLRQTVT